MNVGATGSVNKGSDDARRRRMIQDITSQAQKVKNNGSTDSIYTNPALKGHKATRIGVKVEKFLDETFDLKPLHWTNAKLQKFEHTASKNPVTEFFIQDLSSPEEKAFVDFSHSAQTESQRIWQAIQGQLWLEGKGGRKAWWGHKKEDTRKAITDLRKIFADPKRLKEFNNRLNKNVFAQNLGIGKDYFQAYDLECLNTCDRFTKEKYNTTTEETFAKVLSSRRGGRRGDIETGVGFFAIPLISRFLLDNPAYERARAGDWNGFRNFKVASTLLDAVMSIIIGNGARGCISPYKDGPNKNNFFKLLDLAVIISHHFGPFISALGFAVDPTAKIGAEPKNWFSKALGWVETGIQTISASSLVCFGIAHWRTGMEAIRAGHSGHSGRYNRFFNLYLMGLGQIFAAIPNALAPIVYKFANHLEKKRQEKYVKEAKIEERVKALLERKKALQEKFVRILIEIKKRLDKEYGDKLSQDEIIEKAKAMALKVIAQDKEVIAFETDYKKLREEIDKIKEKASKLPSQIKWWTRFFTMFGSMLIRLQMFLPDVLHTGTSSFFHHFTGDLDKNLKAKDAAKSAWKALNQIQKIRIPIQLTQVLGLTGVDVISMITEAGSPFQMKKGALLSKLETGWVSSAVDVVRDVGWILSAIN